MAAEISLLSASELAERLHLCPATVHAWTKKGIIPAVRINPRVIRFQLNAVLAALENRPLTEGLK